jgi:hypothetical protein
MPRWEELSPIRLDRDTLIRSAAFFDAEGYTCILCMKPPTKRRPTPKYELRVGMTMTHEATVRGFCETFGGYMSLDRRRPKLKYQWQAGQRLALRCLNALAPELTIKRQQADIAAQFMATFRDSNRRGRGRQLDSNLLNERLRLAEQMSALNDSHWHRKRLSAKATPLAK